METIKSAFNRFAERYADAFGQILLIAVAIGLGFFAGRDQFRPGERPAHLGGLAPTRYLSTS